MKKGNDKEYDCETGSSQGSDGGANDDDDDDDARRNHVSAIISLLEEQAKIKEGSLRVMVLPYIYIGAGSYMALEILIRFLGRKASLSGCGYPLVTAAPSLGFFLPSLFDYFSTTFFDRVTLLFTLCWSTIFSFFLCFLTQN